jgi:PAS domain S-box-containing protein
VKGRDGRTFCPYREAVETMLERKGHPCSAPGLERGDACTDCGHRAGSAMQPSCEDAEKTQELMARALWRSEERYKAVVEDQTEIITRYRPDGTYIFVNDVFCRFFGKHKEEVVGHSWKPDALEADLPGIERQLRTLTPSNPVVVVENRVKSGKGSLHWMQFVNRGIFDASGRLVETQTVGRDITERKQAEESLKRYAHRLVTLEEDLRNWIAMELHDDIGQSLSALGFNLGHLGKKLSGEAGGHLLPIVDDSRRLISEISRSVRNLMTEMRPTPLDLLGLPTAIGSYIGKFASRTGLAVTLDCPSQFPKLSGEKEIALFRIVQEALNNISKHSEATKVTVALGCSKFAVHLAIRDNGKGFDARRPLPLPDDSGWGLATMSERAKLLGGTFRVDSDLGKGTCVQVEINRVPRKK